MEPRVSVVIPAFNAEGHLPRALRSALAQTRPAWEILVVDDGSTDRTAEVAAGFGGTVRVLRHGRNRGLSAARNTGIRHALGDWVALLDSDDAWYPAKLERQARAFGADGRGPGFVFCLTRVIRADGASWIDCADAPLPQKDPRGFLADLLVRNAVSGSGCSPVVRRDVLIETGGFDESLRACEDWDLWLRAAARTPFWRVDEVLCEGYARPDGLSLRRDLVLESCDRMLRRRLPEYLPPGEVEAARRRALRVAAGYLDDLQRGMS